MIAFLKESLLCSSCTDQELQDIAGICKTVTAEAGTTIFEAGSPAKFLYVVKEGVVDLRFEVIHYKARKEITLDRKLKGDAFGWSALTEPYVYTLSAVAMKESELLKIEEKDLEKLCAENHHLGFVIMRNIAGIVGNRFTIVRKILIDVIQQSLTDKEP